MRFAFPHLLAAIPLAIVLLGLFQYWAVRRRRRMLERFGSSATMEKLTRGVSPGKRHLKFALLSLGILMTLFALARPQYGAVERPLERRGVEVLIAIDCSLSMLSEDVAPGTVPTLPGSGKKKPNRLEQARKQLRGLIHRLRGDNIGIIAFAGLPVVQCPMTGDYDMALNLLDSISVDSVPMQGTAIGLAIRKAIDTFKNPGKGGKVLVLLTDGEDHNKDPDNENSPLKAAEEAAKAGVVVYAIGIGSTEGSLIPLPGGGYKETSEGQKVSSRLDYQTLMQIAATTKGRVIRSSTAGELEIDQIHDDIDALKKTTLKSKSVVLHIERFQVFLALALFALFLEALLGDRKRKEEDSGAGRFD